MGPEPGQPNPEYAIEPPEPWTLAGPLEDCQLMAKREVLEQQMRAEEQERPENGDEQLEHPCRLRTSAVQTTKRKSLYNQEYGVLARDNLMATEFDEETYGQRWQIETVMFMLKHHQGSALTALTAHSYHTRRREMGLMAVTHNILILRLIKLFYKADLSPFLRLSSQFI